MEIEIIPNENFIENFIENLSGPLTLIHCGRITGEQLRRKQIDSNDENGIRV